MKKSYEIVLVELNNGLPAAMNPGVEEIVVRVKSSDAESAIKLSKTVVAKSWGYKVTSATPIERS